MGGPDSEEADLPINFLSLTGLLPRGPGHVTAGPNDHQNINLSDNSRG